MNYDPMSAAKLVIDKIRRGQPIHVDEGPLGDCYRDSVVAGITPWIEAKAGWIYIAANDGWPGLLKLGSTRIGVAERMGSLNQVGMLTQWKVIEQWKVHDALWIERRIHRALTEYQHLSEVYKVSSFLLKCEILRSIHIDKKKLLKGLSFFEDKNKLLEKLERL